MQHPSYPGSAPFVPQPDPSGGEKLRLRSFANLFAVSGLLYITINLAFSRGLNLLFDWYYKANGCYLFGSSQTESYVATMLTYVFSIAISFGAYAILLKMPLRVALPLRPVDGGNLLLTIPVTFFLSVIGAFLTSLLSMLISVTGYVPVDPQPDIPQTVSGYLLYFFIMVVLPMFFEEIAFRGILLQSLRRFGDGFALVASSLMFGLLHLNLVQTPHAFFLGLWMGYLVLRSGSLWSSIVLHGCVNLSAGILSILIDGATDEALMLINGFYVTFWLIVGGGCILGLFLRNRENGFALHPARTYLKNGEKLSTYFSAPMMLALLAVMAYFMLQYLERIR